MMKITATRPLILQTRWKQAIAGGFSLIELMVSIAIGLLILAAMSSLFVNQLQTRKAFESSNQMIDNGRYAMDLLSQELTLAGFYGPFDHSAVALPGALPDPCSTTMADLEAAVALPVQGVNAATTASTLTNPPLCVPDTLQAGSDILVMRRVNTNPVLQTDAIDGTPYMQVSTCQYDATAYKVDNTPADFTLRQKNCTEISGEPYADLRQMQVQLYFVDQNNEAGDGIPTLKRMQLNDAGNMEVLPLVEGIEFLQVDYGVDSDGDGGADEYVSCAACSVSDWADVMSVRIHLLSRTVNTTEKLITNKVYSLGTAGQFQPAADDSFKRHLYTQVVRLVNPSSRREVP